MRFALWGQVIVPCEIHSPWCGCPVLHGDGDCFIKTVLFVLHGYIAKILTKKKVKTIKYTGNGQGRNARRHEASIPITRLFLCSGLDKENP